MYSIAYPNMLNGAHINLVKDKDAINQNIKLLLLSARNELYGDPGFGTNLKRLLYDQTNALLKDIVIDDIFTTILTFIPQVYLERKDIRLTFDRYNVIVTIKLLNRLDQTANLYEINLTSNE